MATVTTSGRQNNGLTSISLTVSTSLSIQYVKWTKIDISVINEFIRILHLQHTLAKIELKHVLFSSYPVVTVDILVSEGKPVLYRMITESENVYSLQAIYQVMVSGCQ